MTMDNKSELAIKLFKNYLYYYNSTVFLNFWPWQNAYFFCLQLICCKKNLENFIWNKYVGVQRIFCENPVNEHAHFLE